MLDFSSKIVTGIVAVAAMVAASTASYAQDAGDEKTAIRLGWLKASLSTIVQPIAEEQDLYSANGLEATVTAVSSGNNATGIEALMRGDFDVYFGPMTEMARLNAVAVEQNAKPPLVAVAVGTSGATHLVLKKGLAFEGLESLRGKTIGVSSPGSVHLVMFRHFLGAENQTTEGLGINIVRVGGSDMVPALLTNQIDGFLHSQPTPAIAVANDAGFVALAPSEMGEIGRSPTAAIMTRRDWAEKNPEAVKKVIRVFRQASDAFDNMPEEELVRIAQDSIGAEAEVIKSAIPYINPRLMENFDEAGAVYWKTEIAAMKSRGEIVEEFSIQDMFDFGYGDGR